MFGKPGVSYTENLDCYCPACRSMRNQLLHTHAQTSTYKFLDDSSVEDVHPAISSKMPHSVVFGACSSWNDRERTRQVGCVTELQVPLPTAMVFGHVRIVFVSHSHLAN